MIDFINAFTNGIDKGDGPVWSWKIVDCYGSDCLKTEIMDYKYKELKDAGSGGTDFNERENGNKYSSAENCKDDFQEKHEEYRRIFVYTNVGEENVNSYKFDTSKEYIVVVNKWIREVKQDEWGSPSCSGGSYCLSCITCVRSCTDVHDMCERACGGREYQDKKTHHVFLDTSLVIIDKEQAGLMPVLGGTAQSDAPEQGQGGGAGAGAGTE